MYYDPERNDGVLRRFLLGVRRRVREDGRVYLLLSNLGILLGLRREGDLRALFREGGLELVEVHEAPPVASGAPAPPTKEVAKGPSGRLGGVESIKSQEVISLYNLRVKR